MRHTPVPSATSATTPRSARGGHRPHRARVALALAAVALATACDSDDGAATAGTTSGGTGGSAGAGGSAGSTGGAGGNAGGAGASGGAGAAGAAGAGGVAPTCASAVDASRAFGPTEGPFGASLEEWATRWWQWYYALPKASVGAACNLGQPSADVWFLEGTYGETAQRSCTVPAGRSLLVPIAAVNIYFTPEQDCPACAPITAQTDQCVADEFSPLVQLDRDTTCLEVDGVSVGAPAAFLRWSSAFTVTLDPTDPISQGMAPYGANNCGFTEGAPRETWSWGYFVMLQPLAPGQHTIRYFDLAGDGSGYLGDITYTITQE